MVKVREIKRPLRTSRTRKDESAHLHEALTDAASAARGFQHSQPGRGARARRPRVAQFARSAPWRLRAGGRRRRRRDRLFQHHRPDHLHRIMEAYSPGGLHRVAAGAHHSHPLRRREDPRHRPASWTRSRRCGRGCPIPAWASARITSKRPSTTKRGFIVPVTKEAIFFDRTHLILQRAGRGGRDPGPEQGEAADRPGDRRRPTTTTGRAPTYNTYYAAADDALGQRLAGQRIGRLDQRRRRRAVVRQHSRSEHGRAGAGQRQHRCW